MATLIEASAFPLSGQMEIDGLLRPYAPWDFTTDSVIYYTFEPSDAQDWLGYSNVHTYDAVTQDSTRLALTHAATITGIIFTETADSALAELHFVAADVNASGLFTSRVDWHLDASGQITSADVDGYVVLHSFMSNVAPGSFNYQVLLHEVGHALGLKHPHDPDLMFFPAEDNTGNTLMSYVNAGDIKTEFQEYDLAALSWIYGGDGIGGAGAFQDGVLRKFGTADSETITGGAGHDNLFGNLGNDTLVGGTGNDLLSGGGGADSLDGGEGDDRYIVSTGDVLADSSGTDWVFSDASWTLGPGLENLFLYSNPWGTGDTATGNGLNNRIAGNERDNVIAGGAGEDTLAGGFGLDRFVFAEAGPADADLIIDFGDGWLNELVFDAAFFTEIGAAGFSSGDARFFAGPGATSGQDASDRVVYDTSTGRVFYDADGSGAGGALLVATLQGAPSLSAARIDVINAEGDPGMEITGTSGNDSLTGTDGDDTLLGLDGLDTLVGGAGNDSLVGGTGWDTLTGGAGADVLAFAEFGSGMNDAITDFATGTDKIELDPAAFTAIGASGVFAPGDERFWAGPGASTAHDADDRIIYDTTSGILYYDADGNGPGAQARVAILQGTPTLVATDIVVKGEDTSPGGATEGDDTLVGTEGPDSIDGLGGNDSISGLGGDDTLIGGPGVDTLDGGLGNDTYVVLGDGDVLTDAGGSDTVIAQTEVWSLESGFEDLTFDLERRLDEAGDLWPWEIVGTGNELDNAITSGPEEWMWASLDGGDGNDTLVGGFGADVFRFEAGSGDYGHDQIDGGPAGRYDDVVTFYSADGTNYAESAVVIDFRDGTITGGGTGGTGSATFVDIEVAHGGAFNDLLIGNDGVTHSDPQDTMVGGPSLYGRAGNDTLIGGASDDRLSGGEGDDELHGGDGRDDLWGGSGSDQLYGGAGIDFFFMALELDDVEAQGHDLIDGGADVDHLFAPSAESAIVVDLGAGTLVGGGAGGSGSATLLAIESVWGSAFNDHIVGDGTANYVTGGDGNDTIDGAEGQDTLEGGFSGASTGAGSDTFVFSVAPGSANADVVTAFLPDDDNIVLDGNAHANIGSSGSFSPGDPRFWAAPGANAGHDPDDRVVYDTSTGELWYDADGSGSGAAELIATLYAAAVHQADRPALSATDITVINGAAPSGEVINGTSGSDTLTGTSGNDTLNGLGGSDVLIGSGGSDVYDGGAGSDTLDFRAAATGLAVSFAAGTVSGAFAGTFAGIERVLGGDSADELIGGSGGQNLSGRGGADTLEGGVGNDWLWGGGGNDMLVFRETGTANDDDIGDFASGSDKIVLDATVMTALGAPGAFSAGDVRFWSSVSGTAHDADDRVIYETDTRQIWYDPDGNGGSARQLIATLQSGATLVATDIVVEGEDTSSGGATEGDDSLVGTAGDDTIDGLGGNDVLRGMDGADSLRGGAGNDTLISGEGEADFLGSVADGAVDTLDGGLGDDVYHVESGDVILADAGGIDTVFAYGDWTLGAGFENLHIESLGGDGTGNELDNHIESAFEFGTIRGLGGNDTLVVRGAENGAAVSGGAGTDILIGSPAGFESFIFDVAPGVANADLVSNFASGDDRIVLDGNAHANTGPSGAFVAGDERFAMNAAGTAEDASDRVVYNTSTGELWYDADGSGAASAALIATLDGAPGLAATDIEVINGGNSGEHIVGTEGDDTLIGTDGDDTLDGLGGNDELHGGLGSDLLRGGDGNDLLSGREGTDSAPDTLDGGFGNDTFGIDDSNDTLVDAGGIDTVNASLTDWTLGPGFENLHMQDHPSGSGYDGTGNELDNVITGSGDGGTLSGLGGNDRIFSGSIDGSSILLGGEGNDTLTASGFNDDQLFGDAGDDVLHASSVTGFGQLTVLNGGSGADTFVFGDLGNNAIADFASASDSIRLDANAMPDLGVSGRFASGDARFAANATGTAQDSSDRVVYDTSSGALWYDGDGSGAEAAMLIVTLEGVPALAATDIEVINGTSGTPGESIMGTSGSDTLQGGAGDDTLSGLGGGDVLVGSGGSDFYDGGAGSDTLDFRAASTGVAVDFGAGTLSGGFDGTFAGIERVLAGNGNDVLTGAAGAQNLSGRSGSDTLEGGAGNDWLWGGGGNDTFIFRETGTANDDDIGDFSAGSDTIALDNAVMAALGPDGAFGAGDDRFFFGAGASGGADAEDRVVYNTTTGALYYDADGSGSGGAELIATLQGAPGLAATDISVI